MIRQYIVSVDQVEDDASDSAIIDVILTAVTNALPYNDVEVECADY